MIFPDVKTERWTGLEQLDRKITIHKYSTLLSNSALWSTNNPWNKYKYLTLLFNKFAWCPSNYYPSSVFNRYPVMYVGFQHLSKTY